MTKVMIINTTHFDNKGSMGRIEGMINCLEETIPQVQITILHRYYRKDKDTFIRHLINEHPNLEVKEHPWFRETSSNILTAVSSLVRFSILASYRYILHKLGTPLNDELQQSDIIVDLNLIEPTEGVYFMMTVGDFFAFLNTWYATMTAKPVMVCSATIGPYKDRYLRYLARYVLNKVDIITLREVHSQNYLRTLGANKPQIHLSADLAFLLEPADNKRISTILDYENIKKKDKIIVGITPTAMMHPHFKEPQYIKLMAELCNYLIEELNATIIYITHTYQDKPITENIYKQINNKSEVIILPSFSASETKGVIGMCDIFICSRFHALVASTSLAVPSIGIVAYSWGKFHGMIGEMMGQENYLLDVDNEFNYDIFYSELKSKVNDLLINRDVIAESLKERTKIVKEQVLLNGKLINEFIDSVHSPRK